MSYISYPAIFNSVDLNTVPGLTVLKTTPYRPPRRDVSMSEIIRTNKSKLNSAFYTERIVIVKVGITRVNRDQLEESIDALMNLVQGTNKELVLRQSSNLRKYYCTLEEYIVNEEVEGGSYIEMDLNFTCTDRFGYALAPDVLLTITSFTSQSRSDRLTFGGSALTQVPVIRLVYSSITGGTAKAVTIGNGDTGQQIVVTRTWTTGDILEIDCFNKTVKVNNTEVDFTGAIPEWATGFGYWSYFDTLTTRTFSGTITQVKRYV